MRKILNWINKNRETLLKSCYSLPILFAIFISINHCIRWFEIANPNSFAILLSVGVEVAAFSTLLALIFSKGKSFNIWLTFFIVTFVQILGNVFYSFNFIDETGQLFQTWQKFVKIIFDEAWDIDKSKFWLSVLEGSIVPLLSLLSLDLIANFEMKDKKKDDSKMKVLTTTEEIKPTVEEIYHRPGTAVLDKVEEILKNEEPIIEENSDEEEMEEEKVNEIEKKEEVITPEIVKVVPEEDVKQIKKEELTKKNVNKAGPLAEGIPPKQQSGIIPKIKITNKKS